jgi:hypothetical protein
MRFAVRHTKTNTTTHIVQLQKLKSTHIYFALFDSQGRKEAIQISKVLANVTALNFGL